MSEPLIDIRPDLWVIVRDILQKHVPQCEVWAFGSRAKWKAKKYSDLDLAVITHKPMSLQVSGALADDFAESDLPFKVDVVDWATTSESFRKIIEQDKVVVQTELPHMKVRSNSLDVVGNLMVVANQTKEVNMKPAGFDIWDISLPEKPRLISHFDCSGPYSRGVHAVWFVDGQYVHTACGAEDFQPRDQKDDQRRRQVGDLKAGPRRRRCGGR